MLKFFRVARLQNDAQVAPTGPKGRLNTPQSLQKLRIKPSDCVTFGRTCAQHNAPIALNRIIGQECSHRNGNDTKRETQNFKTKLVGPTNLPGPWGCDTRLFELRTFSRNVLRNLPDDMFRPCFRGSETSHPACRKRSLAKGGCGKKGTEASGKVTTKRPKESPK